MEMFTKVVDDTTMNDELIKEIFSIEYIGAPIIIGK